MSDFIEKIEYLKEDYLFAGLSVKEPCKAAAYLNGSRFVDLENIAEPFDAKFHLFKFPIALLEKYKRITLEFFINDEEHIEIIEYDEKLLVEKSVAISRSDRNLIKKSEERQEIANGVSYSIEEYETNDKKIVRTFVLECEKDSFEFVSGTPFGMKQFEKNKIQIVMDEAKYYESNGEKVLAATNGDFFDMFGNCSPSGLCVRDGHVVYNPQNLRPFLCTKKDGQIDITDISKIDIEDIKEAVSGKQLIVKNGEIFDTARLTPFGDTPHPRTACGITEEGKLFLIVVDGRRPDWSNGASLTELSKMFISKNCSKALNMDGGGSSTFIINNGEELQMINHPADLYKPFEDLIRPLFDSIIILKK